MPNYPQLFRLRQTFERPTVVDVAQEVKKELDRLKIASQIQPGQSVAITAGSRGITNIALIIKTIAEYFKQLGAVPFIVPAMGSHGGATVEGQRRVIESFGITEKYCGCEIRAGMETDVVCQAAEGFPVYCDRHALQADHVLVCGRVKPHTGFIGDIESGLMKMLLLGLGKHDGAKIYHRAILDYSFEQIVRSVAGEVIKKCNVLAGLAVVENAYDETAKLVCVAPDEFEAREKELLVLAKQWLPRLPFREADLLLIDEIGKNISGTGLDTNVVGRKYRDHKAGENEYPKIRYLVVRGLTEETYGNATGIGLAEFCLTRAKEQLDIETTRINCLTSARPIGAMLPLDFETDREILDAALPICGLVEPGDAKIMWIRNTGDVIEVECSAAYLAEVDSRGDLDVLTPLREMPFDAAGNLPGMLEVEK